MLSHPVCAAVAALVLACLAMPWLYVCVSLCVCASLTATFAFSALLYLLTFWPRGREICMIFALMCLIYHLFCWAQVDLSHIYFIIFVLPLLLYYY